jgi:hypothetical protein
VRRSVGLVALGLLAAGCSNAPHRTTSLDMPAPSTTAASDTTPSTTATTTTTTAAAATTTTTTTTVKPTTTTTAVAAPAWTLTQTGTDWHGTLTESGTGCTGPEAGVTFTYYDPSGQPYDGDGAASQPDGSWATQQSITTPADHPVGRYKVMAACFNYNSMTKRFTYAPEYFTITG